MTQYYLSFLILVSVSLCEHPSPAAADDRLTYSEESLLNLSSEELVRRLGRPDSKISAGEREEWRYGNSIIFLIGNRVNAWSDSGDLANRRLLSGLRAGSRPSIELIGWRNSWETEEPVKPDDVIMELVK
jgi:hypothetical protein